MAELEERKESDLRNYQEEDLKKEEKKIRKIQFNSSYLFFFV